MSDFFASASSGPLSSSTFLFIHLFFCLGGFYAIYATYSHIVSLDIDTAPCVCVRVTRSGPGDDLRSELELALNY